MSNVWVELLVGFVWVLVAVWFAKIMTHKTLEIKPPIKHLDEEPDVSNAVELVGDHIGLEGTLHGVIIDQSLLRHEEERKVDESLDIDKYMEKVNKEAGDRDHLLNLKTIEDVADYQSKHGL